MPVKGAKAYKQLCIDDKAGIDGMAAKVATSQGWQGWQGWQDWQGWQGWQGWQHGELAE